MRRLLSPVVLFALTLLVSSSVGADDKFKLEEGFKLIFNGKNFDGWKEASGKNTAALDGKSEAFKGRFKITEGKIVIDPSVKGGAYIETKKEYGKGVHIKFDFKAGPKCNNDIFLRNTKFDIVPGNKENKDVKEGEWYTCEVISGDDTIEHKINGKSARKTKVNDKTPKASPFKLRAEFGEMEVKNIRVKE